MLRALLIAVLVALSMPALAAYKCESGGKTVYSDTPCPDARAIDIGDPASPSEAAKIRQQTAQENRKAKQLENARHRREAGEERERQRAARAHAAKARKCAALEQRRNWSRDDAATASGRTAAKARLKARRAEEKFQAACAQ